MSRADLSPVSPSCLSSTAIIQPLHRQHLTIITRCAHHDIAHVMTVTAVLVSCATCQHSPRSLHTPQGCCRGSEAFAHRSPSMPSLLHGGSWSHMYNKSFCVADPALSSLCAAALSRTAEHSACSEHVEVRPPQPATQDSHHSCRQRRDTAGRSAVMAVVGRRIWWSGMCSTAVCSRAETGDAKP